MKVFTGDFFKIYDPSAGKERPWYVNDHTVIKGDGGWHLFGITHEEPAKPQEERLCAHAVTTDILNTPFIGQASPLCADANMGEKHFWAPHVIKNEDTYYMYYCAGSLEGHDKYRIHLATSTDLWEWHRHSENPMLTDGYDARDPMVLRVGEEWVMYYTCNSTPVGGHHCVACVTSADLVHWENRRVVFTSDIVGTYAGPCESPFVERVGETYFLFIGPFGGYKAGYSNTAVYASKDPFRFEGEPVGILPCHAAEVLNIDGERYITHCGWGEGGVYLASLHFDF